MSEGLRTALATIAAALAALLAIVLGLALAGYGPGELAAAAWRGAFGTPRRAATTFQEAAPLLLTGLAAATAFRAGVLNIGGQGQSLLGSAAAAALLTTWAPPVAGDVALTLALAASALAGAAFALVATALERWRGVPVVLATILLNFVALHLVGMIVDGPLRDPTTTAPQTAMVDDARRLPILAVADGVGVHVGVPFALLLPVVAWIALRRTTAGFALDVVGRNPDAARIAGIRVERVQALAMACSGALAGLAGGCELAGVTHFLTENPQSYGFVGVAVALLGRLHPAGIVAAALFFAALGTGARVVERDVGVPRDIADAARGLVLLAALAGGAWLARRRAPGGAAP